MFEDESVGLLSTLIEVIYPTLCVNCRRSGAYFCPACQKQLVWVTQPICPVCKRSSVNGLTHPYCRTRLGLDGLSSGFHLQGPLKKAIHTLKYRQVTHLTKTLTDFWLQSLEKQGITFQTYMVVPIPLHWSRYQERGFNQAALLAQGLAKGENLEFTDQALTRVKATHTQVALTEAQRRENLREAFTLKTVSEIKGKKVLLVDDVLTTGATLGSAARTLKKAGASVVWGLTLARAQSY